MKEHIKETIRIHKANQELRKYYFWDKVVKKCVDLWMWALTKRSDSKLQLYFRYHDLKGDIDA